MACYHPPVADPAVAPARLRSSSSGHSAFVRITHWITAFCFLALLLSGVEILISHPRFYWGETGNVLTKPLFIIPIPASRSIVPTGYGYVLPDQNGWSRYLHFQSAWFVVFAGLAYVIYGVRTGHFRRRLLPPPGATLLSGIAEHLRFPPLPAPPGRYNVLQKLSYLVVIFVAFPLIVWTGLAMSPAFTAAFPFTVEVFGGQQSARTIHFFLTVFLVAFFLVHLVMVILTGFRTHMRAMTVGAPKERT